MKAMILSDLIIMRKYLVQQSAVGLVLGVVLAFVMENPYAVLPLVGVMVSVTCAFTVLALDERNGWERYRLALPISRASVVAGRYASIGVAVAAGFAAGLAASLAVVAIAGALAATGNDGVRALVEGLSWGAFALSGAMGLLIIAAMLAVTLPLAMRFGMTKAVRFIPIAMALVVLVAFAASGSGDALHIAEFFGKLLSNANGPAMLAAAGVAASVALYAASAAIAARLYEAREL